MRVIKTGRAFVMMAALMVPALCGCGQKDGDQPGPAPNGARTSAGAKLSGTILVDGSSTVLPISEAVAEEFIKVHPDVKVPVGKSGTGGGFKKFANKETEVSDASRPIKTEEAETAKKNGVDFIELPVAYDGLSIVVHPSNNWVDHLTVEELKRIWEPGSKVNNWSQVRPGFPDKPIKLYGAGTDSGTFDYFTDAINGKEGASRSDYTASEDDNTLVQGVAGDPNALGYFGFAYYEENKDKLKIVPIKMGDGPPVAPSPESINTGTYQPLSRPLFIYVRRDVADRPEVQAFVEFYLTKGKTLVGDVGYIPLPDKAYELAQERYKNRKTGSIFTGGSQVGVKIEDLLSKETGQ